MTTNTNINWNDPAILAAAGANPVAVQTLLRSNQQPIASTMAVYQWVSRGRIPDRWRPKLVYALLREQKIKTGQLFRTTLH